jgi:hypothetical protein
MTLVLVTTTVSVGGGTGGCGTEDDAGTEAADGADDSPVGVVELAAATGPTVGWPSAFEPSEPNRHTNTPATVATTTTAAAANTHHAARLRLTVAESSARGSRNAVGGITGTGFPGT